MKLLFFIIIYLLSNSFYAQSPGVNYIHFSSQEQQINMAYVYQKAERPNGKTVLLLHGKNFSHTYWQTTIDALTEDGYNVIAPDQVGFGNSTKPQHYQHTFQQCAVNTKSLLDSLGILNVIVVAHSMGGMIATRFALMYPRVCTKLILENPIGLEDWKIIVPYSTIDEAYKKEKNKTREELKSYFITNYFHDQWKEEYDPILDETISLYRSKDSLVYAKNMALTSDMIFTQPVCYEFKNIKVPTVLIIGQADKTAIGKEKVDGGIAKMMGNYAELGGKTAAQISGCRLIELQGLGHIPHVEDFKMFMNSLEDALNN